MHTISNDDIRKKRGGYADDVRKFVALASRSFYMSADTTVGILRSTIDTTPRTETAPVLIDGHDVGMTKTTTFNNDGSADICFRDNEGNKTASLHLEPSEDGAGCTMTARDSKGAQETIDFVAREDNGTFTVKVGADVEGGLSSSVTMSTGKISGSESSWSVEVIEPTGDALSGVIEINNSTGEVIGATSDLANELQSASGSQGEADAGAASGSQGEADAGAASGSQGEADGDEGGGSDCCERDGRRRNAKWSTV